jgi:hypothetical protein
VTTHLITFATDDMSESAALCRSSAVANGVNGGLFHFSPYNVARLQCYEQNRTVFDAPRGAGYWAWKPALIDRLIAPDCFIRNINDGDVVIYADAGIEFINNVNYIIDRMDQDIFLFGNQWAHAHWCKRDIIEAVWPWVPPEKVWDGEKWRDWYHFGKQVQASVIFFRVNDTTRAFVKEWLDWCLFESGRLIDDSPSRAPNHPEFQENRHDQAILTTMAYRDGIKLHHWSASYNDGAFTYPLGDYVDEGIPILFNHHRKRDHEWSKET